MSEYRHEPALRRRVAENLARHPVEEVGEEGLRLAAVALAITTNAAGQPAIILTLRPARRVGSWEKRSACTFPPTR